MEGRAEEEEVAAGLLARLRRERKRSRPGRKPRPGRWAPPQSVSLMATSAILCVAAVACGEVGNDPGVASLGGAADGASPGGEGKKDSEEQLLAFAKCMREQGIDFPDPVDDGTGLVRFGPEGDFDPQKLQDAHGECAPLLPDEGGELDPETAAALQDAMVEYAACMRDQGIDMPDPTDGGLLIDAREGDSLDPASPEFKAADRACNHILREAEERAGIDPPTVEGAP